MLIGFLTNTMIALVPYLCHPSNDCLVSRLLVSAIMDPAGNMPWEPEYVDPRPHQLDHPESGWDIATVSVRIRSLGAAAALENAQTTGVKVETQEVL